MMSYKHDVCLLLKEENLIELDKKIAAQGFEDEELLPYRQADIWLHQRNFMTFTWKYVTWDAATNEVVQMVEEYIDMLDKNNIPFRYVTIGELGETVDRKNYGKDPEDIAVISSVYPKPIIYNGLNKIMR